jgi:hypothetical protein
MKQGLDYFPLDVSLSTKIELVEAQYGLQGFAIVIKLWQMIYAQKGYYLEWNEEVELLFAKRAGVKSDYLSEIVEALTKRGIFDRDLYEKYQILTSSGCQERYFGVVKQLRRKEIEVDERFLLVKVTDFLPNDNILWKNAYIFNENDNISQQKKRNEMKRNEKKYIGAPNGAPATQKPTLIKSNRFIKPTVQEVADYCKERNNNINPEAFIDFYESKGWMVGKNHMKDWRAAIRQWERREKDFSVNKGGNTGFGSWRQNQGYDLGTGAMRIDKG